MAPILSFTAEEAWPLFSESLWQEGGETIFSQVFGGLPEIPDASALLAKWSHIRQARSEVMKALEHQRSQSLIGSSLQADIEISASEALFDALDSLGADDDWFCWMSFPDPHHPWDPPKSERHRIDWRDVPLPAGYPQTAAEREAILDGKPLIAPGAEGMGSVELANVLLYSSLINQSVELPMDSKAWENKLNELIANSRHEKKVVQSTAEDFTKSFNK